MSDVSEERFLVFVFFLAFYFLFYFILFFLGWVGGGGWGGAIFSDGAFFKRHLVTSCRSAKFKQIFCDTRHTHD